MNVRRERGQFRSVFASVVDIAGAPAVIDPHVAAVGPTQARKRLSECGEETLRRGIDFIARHEHADASHTGLM